MTDTWQPINNGRQQASFKRFKETIPPGGIYQLVNPFNCFRCYDATAEFKVAWSTNADPTDFGQGMMVQFPDVIPYAQITNPTAAPLTIDVGVGIGTFEDSRLTVSGEVKTVPGGYHHYSATTYTLAEGQVTIPPAGKTIIQNTGQNTMYIGGTGTNGLQLHPQGTFEYTLGESLTLFGTNGDTLAVGSFN